MLVCVGFFSVADARLVGPVRLASRPSEKDREQSADPSGSRDRPRHSPSTSETDPRKDGGPKFLCMPFKNSISPAGRGEFLGNPVNYEPLPGSCCSGETIQKAPWPDSGSYRS